MSVATFKSDWRNVIVKCPDCGATQTERVVMNVNSFKGIDCFYCNKHFYYDHFKKESKKCEF